MMKLIFRMLISSILVLTIISCNQSKTIKMHDSHTESGLIIKKSSADFETTYSTLKNTIEANPNLKLILELDHSKNAASKNLSLRPTRILFFGNPALGTPLMQSQPTLAIDLPQKILVYQEEDGTVKVAYNDPNYLKSRHGLKDNQEVLDKISGALNKITEMAIGN